MKKPLKESLDEGIWGTRINKKGKRHTYFQTTRERIKTSKFTSYENYKPMQELLINRGLLRLADDSEELALRAEVKREEYLEILEMMTPAQRAYHKERIKDGEK